MFKLKFSQIKTLFEEKRILLGKINYPGVDVNTLLNTKGQLSDLYIKHGRIKDEDFCIFPDAFSIEPYSCFFTGTTFCSMGGGG